MTEDELIFRLTELERRLANVIRLGAVEQADYAGARVRVRIGELLTAWLPWLTRRAGGDIDWWAPEVGEQVLVLAPSGELAQAVVLPALYQIAYPAVAAEAAVHRQVYADSAVIEYDRAAHHLKAVLPSGGSAELIAPGGIRIVGDITHEGQIVSTGDHIAGGISLINHVHGGVQSGGSTTGGPQ